MKEFDFPTNIKQIGTIEPGLKIYMEDYVCSYLSQYAQAAGYDERLATLVGRYMFIDSSPVIFISGAILGKYTEEDGDIVRFSEKSLDYVDQQLNMHFRDTEILGWMQSQPGYGTFLNPQYKAYHQTHFNKPHQVMFVVDPMEKLNTFYINKDDNLTESAGYFIYYEKNHSMHEYMMENKILRSISPNFAKSQNHDAQPMENPFQFEKFGPKLEYSSEAAPTYEMDSREEYENYENEENVVNINRARKNPKKAPTSRSQRRVVNMLVSMSSVVLLISFVMGAALIRSEDRLNHLEQELAVLTNAYVNIVQSLQATQEAFAMQSTAVLIEEDGAALAGDTEPQPTPDPTPEVQQETAPAAPPQEAAIPSIANLPQTYVVQQGDNLLAISQMFYGTTGMVEHIMYLNNIEDPNMIFQGMILLLPNSYGQ